MKELDLVIPEAVSEAFAPDMSEYAYMVMVLKDRAKNGATAGERDSAKCRLGFYFCALVDEYIARTGIEVRQPVQPIEVRGKM